MAEYSTELAGALERYFGMNRTPHTFDETAGTFRLSVPVEGKLRRIDTKILCTEKAIMSSTSLPVAAVPEAMEQTASLLMRLNNVMNFGGWYRSCWAMPRRRMSWRIPSGQSTEPVYGI